MGGHSVSSWRGEVGLGGVSWCVEERSGLGYTFGVLGVSVLWKATGLDRITKGIRGEED